MKFWFPSGGADLGSCRIFGRVGQPGGSGPGLEVCYPTVLSGQFPPFIPRDSRSFGIPILHSHCHVAVGARPFLPVYPFQLCTKHTSPPLHRSISRQSHKKSKDQRCSATLETTVMANLSDNTSKNENISVWERKEKDGNNWNPGLQFFTLKGQGPASLGGIVDRESLSSPRGSPL